MTFIASVSVFCMLLVTEELWVTVTPTLVGDSLVSMPGIKSWLDVPNLGTKVTSWWLKSVEAGFVESAVDLSIGVLFKKISFNAAL